MPTVAPAGRVVKSYPLLVTSTSLASSRPRIDAIQNSGLIALGKSFMEWTARSALLSNRATSSSFINKPFPPILDRDISKTLSPSVVISTNSILKSGFKAISLLATKRLCQRANWLARVAIRITLSFFKKLFPRFYNCIMTIYLNNMN